MGDMSLVQTLVREKNKADALILHLIDHLHQIREKGDGESRRIVDHALDPKSFTYEDWLGKTDGAPYLGAEEGKAEPRPGGLRSIEQAVIEDIHRITNLSLPAHARLALIDATIIEYRVRARKQAPQSPTAQSAPPPAGPRDALTCMVGEAQLFPRSRPKASKAAPAPPVEPPAPRPMKLRADRLPWEKCRDMDCECPDRQKAERCNVNPLCALHWMHWGPCFTAPEARAGEAP